MIDSLKTYLKEQFDRKHIIRKTIVLAIIGTLSAILILFRQNQITKNRMNQMHVAIITENHQHNLLLNLHFEKLFKSTPLAVIVMSNDSKKQDIYFFKNPNNNNNLPLAKGNYTIQIISPITKRGQVYDISKSITFAMPNSSAKLTRSFYLKKKTTIEDIENNFDYLIDAKQYEHNDTKYYENLYEYRDFIAKSKLPSKSKQKILNNLDL